jgi:hypothetical protein
MKLIKTLAVFAALFTSVNAATISFDMAADTLAVAPLTNAKLDPTYTMYLGKYNNAALSQNPSFADINAGFTILSTTSFLGADGAGYVSSGDNTFTDAAGFSGAQLFVWFTNGTNQNALITGFGTIPADASIPNSVAFALDSTNAASLTYTVGHYDANINSASGGSVVLAGVPEPSAALLGAVGVLGLLRRRRN